MPRKLMINISGEYVDPDAICYARQDGKEVVIHIAGTNVAVTVGIEYWNKLCAQFLKVEIVA